MAQGSTLTMFKFEYNKETAHEDFPEYIFLFENFLLLAGINKAETVNADATPGAKVAFQHLVHSCGSIAVKLLKGFEAPADVTYEQLKKAIEDYCSPKDTAAMLYKFDSLKQSDGESIHDFVLRLKALGTSAGITTVNMEKELIRRIAQNTNATKIKLKVLEKDMTVTKLINWETARTSQQACLAATSSANINYVNESQINPQKRKWDNKESSSKKRCGYCGYDLPHKGPKCPAEGKKCNNCSGANHFERACRKPSNGKSSNASHNNNVNSNNRNSSISSNKRVYHVTESKESDKDFPMFNKFYTWMKEAMEDGSSTETFEQGQDGSK